MNYGKVAYTKVTQLEKHFQNLYKVTQRTAENTLSQKKDGVCIPQESWDFHFSCSKAGSVLINCSIVANCQEEVEIQHFFNGVYIDSTFLSQTQAVGNFSYTVKNASSGSNRYSTRFISTNSFTSCITMQVMGSFVEQNVDAVPFTCLDDDVVYGKLVSPTVYVVKGEETAEINLQGQIVQCKLLKLDSVLHLLYLQGGSLILRRIDTSEEKTLALGVSNFSIVKDQERVMFLVVRNKVYRAILGDDGQVSPLELCQQLQTEKAMKVFCTKNQQHKVLVVQSASRLCIYETENWSDFVSLVKSQERSASDVIVDGDTLKVVCQKENLCQKAVFSLTNPQEEEFVPIRYLSGVCFKDANQLLCSQFEKLSLYSI